MSERKVCKRHRRGFWSNCARCNSTRTILYKSTLNLANDAQNLFSLSLHICWVAKAWCQGLSYSRQGNHNLTPFEMTFLFLENLRSTEFFLFLLNLILCPKIDVKAVPQQFVNVASMQQHSQNLIDLWHS